MVVVGVPVFVRANTQQNTRSFDHPTERRAKRGNKKKKTRETRRKRRKHDAVCYFRWDFQLMVVIVRATWLLCFPLTIPILVIANRTNMKRWVIAWNISLDLAPSCSSVCVCLADSINLFTFWADLRLAKMINSCSSPAVGPTVWCRTQNQQHRKPVWRSRRELHRNASPKTRKNMLRSFEGDFNDKFAQPKRSCRPKPRPHPQSGEKQEHQMKIDDFSSQAICYKLPSHAHWRIFIWFDFVSAENSGCFLPTFLFGMKIAREKLTPRSTCSSSISPCSRK